MRFLGTGVNVGQQQSWLVESDTFVIESVLSKCFAEGLRDYFPLVNRLRSSQRIVVITDFSGPELQQSYTTGILVADYNDLMHWYQTDLSAWRATEKVPGTIGYKKITDTDERDLIRLNRFLQCASRLPGILVTVTVPKNPKRFFTKKGDCTANEHRILRGKLGDKTFESLRRFATFLSVVLKPIHRSDQHLLWLCDHDDIIADESICNTTQLHIAAQLGAVLGRPTLPGLVKPSDIVNTMAAEDVLAVPDVAAGAIGEYLQASHIHYGHHGLDGGYGPPPNVKSKATEIAIWFGMKETQLVKLALSLDPAECLAMLHPFEYHPIDSGC